MTAVWRNWARTERSTPELEVAPHSVEQVVLAVNRARETGHAVKPIGASHSFTGIGATDGIRLSMRKLRGLAGVDLARGRVTLWGGTHLRELPALLDPLGLALENMGDIDSQTITGATQTGTHGTGLGFGGLSARIVGATLVTGTGEVLTVSETENPELLPAVALGLGALGVLITVTVQCVPKFVLRAVEAPMSLDAVLDSFVDRVRREDHFEFFWFPHTFGARTKTNTRLSGTEAIEPLSRAARLLDEELLNNGALGALVNLERVVPSLVPRVNRLIEAVSSSRSYSDVSHRVFVTSRRVRFREMEYAIPLEAVPEVVRELNRMIERKRHRVSFPVEVRAAAGDQLLLSTAHGRETGYVAVHRFWKERDHSYFRDAEHILAAHEGRPHWGKMHSQTADTLAERYPKFAQFVKARDQLDPDRVFRNPYLARVLGR